MFFVHTVDAGRRNLKTLQSSVILDLYLKKSDDLINFDKTHFQNENRRKVGLFNDYAIWRTFSKSSVFVTE